MSQYRRITILTRKSVHRRSRPSPVAHTEKRERIVTEGYHLNADSELLPDDLTIGESQMLQLETIGFHWIFQKVTLFHISKTTIAADLGRSRRHYDHGNSFTMMFIEKLIEQNRPIGHGEGPR